MAFNLNKFQKVSGGAQAVHAYNTADAITTVTASGYFNSVATSLKQFDIIHVVSSTGGTPTIDSIFVTSADFAAVVTTSATEGVTSS